MALGAETIGHFGWIPWLLRGADGLNLRVFSGSSPVSRKRTAGEESGLFGCFERVRVLLGILSLFRIGWIMELDLAFLTSLKGLEFRTVVP